MKEKIEYKNKLLEQRAFLEALIKQNKKYFKTDQVSGLEFSNYLEKIQKAYDDFLFEKSIELQALIPSNVKLISAGELIKGSNFPSNFYLDFYNNKNLGIIAVDDDVKRDKFIKLFGYDAYYKLEVLIRSIKDYTSKNGLLFPSILVHPLNPAISIGISDSSFTFLETIDNFQLRYGNFLGRYEKSIIKPDYSEELLLIANEDLLNLYINSIRLNDEVLPEKMVQEIKKIRLVKKQNNNTSYL
mgnify:FL=1